MAKKDNMIEEIPTVIEPKDTVVSSIPALPTKRFTFEQWAGNRMIKEHHKSGLRTFCGNPNKLRTMEEWDKAFEQY